MTDVPPHFAKVLGHFEGLRPTGRPLHWMAKCPAHEDRTPSLSIRVGSRTGKLLVKCMSDSGCYLEDVLKAVGLTIHDLTPECDRGEWDGRRAESPRRRVIESYDYLSEQGRLLYQVLRYHPKAFSQRIPDPAAGPDCWHPGLGDVRRVLYRLPQLLGKPAQPVLVVEGERKVHKLEEWGLVATCNVGGTGMGWKDEYSESLRGRRVVILPDNDLPGLKHACFTAGSLLRHGAASVRLVELPGLGDKEDVCDWSRKGGTRDQLISIITGCAEWRPHRPERGLRA